MTRSSSYASNIAQLEATAEKLSMTSSIEDAIRDLHEGLKRNDGRRSSLLTASISGSDTNSASPFPFPRQVSVASSILEINNAARFGGYSPAGYVMSPNHSLRSNPTRLRSGSHTRSEGEAETLLSRSGVGKSSIRSAKSTTKPSLCDIAEMEMPTTLTSAAMDAADKLEEHPEEDEYHMPPTHDIDLTPNPQHTMSNANDYWDQAVIESQNEQADGQHEDEKEERPSTSAESVGTYEQAERAFADFDGAHCSPSPDHELEPLPPSFAGPSFDLPYEIDLNLEMPAGPDLNRPRISNPFNPTARPKSYMDPESGQQMLYYPARVPLMLNLPQKLSKKPKADAEMSKRRSQILSMMPEANRQSASWLPEVIPEPLLNTLGSAFEPDLATPRGNADSINGNLLSPTSESRPDSQHQSTPRPSNDEARKSRMSLAMSNMDLNEKRKSRMSVLSGLPPQLRASAFFDLPSEPSPKLELKDGSAMATLDSILDASAKAPVSAFTDHTFAGKLGSEVYGTEKKRRSHIKQASQADGLAEVKKRRSFFHLRTPSKLSSKSSNKEDRSKTITGNPREDNDSGSDDETSHLSRSKEGEEDEEEAESEEEQLYDGPPTTLLAELQLRKQQQKMRTRPITQAFPNGLHSTLLEMDTVAEIERKNRRVKKVNLAWEEPEDDGQSEEDVPLALLMAAKGASADGGAAQAELDRPLGLMERREQEDNEPLSMRRDRLQGRDPGPMLPSLKRQSMMTLGTALRGGRTDLVSPRTQIQSPEEDEVEGETLGQRMRRIRGEEDGGNPLPRARPVSTAFSVEMFSEIGDHFKKNAPEPAPADDAKVKKMEEPKEEEETLGQRRRRLQAEREAREKEMGGSGNLNTDFALPTLKQRHSMADILGSNRSRLVLTDPRAEAERSKQEGAARFKWEQEQKLAALRAQMPANLTQPQASQSGAFMNGQFNDGNAGGMGFHRASMWPGNFGQTPVMGHQVGSSFGMGTYGVSNGYGMQMQNDCGAYGTSATNGYGMPMQMQMQSMQQPGQQHDRVNQWRQSVVPQGPF